MKSFAIASAVIMLCAASARAGDLAVADSTLENMGLGQMQQLSDADGRQVRGQGLLDAFGPAMDGFLDSALGEMGLQINGALFEAGAGDVVGDIGLDGINLDGFGGIGGIGGGLSLGGGFDFGAFGL